MSNLIDLNSRRLRGQSPLDIISRPYFGYVPDDGRVFGRRNDRLPLNRRFSNGRFAIPQHTPVDILQRENYSMSTGRNYRYQNPFAVGNSQTYENPNFKARYTNNDFSFPLQNPGPGPGDGFNMRDAVYGRPYGGFQPIGAGNNRISGRSISNDQDIETFSTLSPAGRDYNRFGFPQKRKNPTIEGYQPSQSPYDIPLNALNLPTSIHEPFSNLKQNTNQFGVPIRDATISGQSRIWDEVAREEANRDRLEPEMFSPQTNQMDQMVLINLLILSKPKDSERLSWICVNPWDSSNGSPKEPSPLPVAINGFM